MQYMCKVMYVYFIFQIIIFKLLHVVANMFFGLVCGLFVICKIEILTNDQLYVYVYNCST